MMLDGRLFCPLTGPGLTHPQFGVSRISVDKFIECGTENLMILVRVQAWANYGKPTCSSPANRRH